MRLLAMPQSKFQLLAFTYSPKTDAMQNLMAVYESCLNIFFALLFNLVQTLSIDSPRYKNEDVPPRSSDNIAIQMKSTVVQTLGAL